MALVTNENLKDYIVSDVKYLGNCAKFDHHDSATNIDYYKILSPACGITIYNLENGQVVSGYTYGNLPVGSLFGVSVENQTWSYAN